MEKDGDMIAGYRNPAYVLGGWTPKMAPLILSQPQSMTATASGSAMLRVQVAAIPEASFQWFKNGKAVSGADNATLALQKVSATDVGTYTVTIKNDSGSVISSQAVLKIK
jgi:pectinesterase